MSVSRRVRLVAVIVVLMNAFGAAARDYSGVVVDRATKNPLAGVLVSVDHTESYARTDQDGRFAITNGTTAAAEGFARKAEPRSARWRLSGRALDLRSVPGAAFVSVYAVNGKRVFGGRVPASMVVELPGLAAGAYMLELRGGQGALARAQIVSAGRAGGAYAFGVGSAGSGGGDRRLGKRSQSLAAASERLIFRHDDYYPADSAMTASNTDMRIELRQDERRFIFDQSVVREYRFTINQSDLDYLNKYGYREELVPADLNFDGVNIGRVGVRYKGSDYTLPRCFFPNGDTTRGTPNKTCAKISYKIKFTQYDEDKRLYGMKKLNLHALTADATKMHEMISYELFREMGIPAPRTSYANVYVNNSLIGLFLAVEEIDGRFAKSRWPVYGDGNLYKEVWPKTADARYYLDGLATNDDPGDNPDVQRMVSYYNAIQSSNNQNFAQNLAEYMDFDYFLRYLAVDVAIKNWDGMRSWYMNSSGTEAANHNYYFYEEENSGGKTWIIPWDMDQALMERDTYFDAGVGFGGFGGGQPLPQWNVPTTNCGAQSVGQNRFMPPNCDPLTKLTANKWDRYVQLGDLFLKDVFVSQRLNDKIAKHTGTVTSAVQQDPNINESTWTRDVNSLKNYLPNSISSFRSYLHP